MLARTKPFIRAEPSEARPGQIYQTEGAFGLDSAETATHKGGQRHRVHPGRLPEGLDEGAVRIRAGVENAVVSTWGVEASVGRSTEVKGIVMQLVDSKLRTSQIDKRQDPGG